MVADRYLPKKLGHNHYAQIGSRKGALVLVLQLIVFAVFLALVWFLPPSAPV